MSASLPSRIDLSAAQIMRPMLEWPVFEPRPKPENMNNLIGSSGIGQIVMVASACDNRRSAELASWMSFTLGRVRMPDNVLASPEPFGMPSRAAQLSLPVRPRVAVIS